MKKCSYCDSAILLGGISDGEKHFCSTHCEKCSPCVDFAKNIPQDLVYESTLNIFRSPCPKCHSGKHVDVHFSYTIWSAIVITSWRSNPYICCSTCGLKYKLKGIAYSMMFGWWSLPWGILMTPVQIFKNLLDPRLFRKKTAPSRQLTQLVRIHLATKFANEHIELEPLNHIKNSVNEHIDESDSYKNKTA